MKKKNIVAKKSFWTKRNTISSLIIVVLITLSTVFIVRYTQVSNAMLSSHLIYTFQNNVVKSITISDNILVGTDKGDVALLTPLGKIIWSQNIKSRIHTLDVSGDSKYIIVGGTSFHLYNIDGKVLFDKSLTNYFPYKCKFIDSKTIMLLYQSLSDLSFNALTVDYTGKTLNSQKISDLGETASLDLSQGGSVLFAGERGEVYKIVNGKLANDVIIDQKSSTVHQIFGTYITPNRIVVGYRISSNTESNTVPVYFYDENLKLIKSVDIPSNINSFTIDNGNIIFATDSGFFIYSETGELQGQKIQSDLSGLQFSTNAHYNMYVYEKKPAQENDKPVINILLTDKDNKLQGSFLYTFDSIPEINLSSTGKIIFVAEKNELSILSR